MADELPNLSGGCHCGAVRYTILEPPLSVQHCHCESCRKTTGCFYNTGGVMRQKKVNIEGLDNLTKYRTSKSFEIQFCRTCGCSLFAYEDGESEYFYLNLPTLDGGTYPGHPREVESHAHVRSKAPWEYISDEIPQFEREGPGEIITEIQKADI